MVLGEIDVAECGAFRDQKQDGSKLLSVAPNSHAHSNSYLIIASGHPLVIRPYLDLRRYQLMDTGR
jgi:hypothetical protein